MFVVPKSKKTIKANRFEFEYDGKKYSVPLFKFAPVEASLMFESGQYVEGLMLCAGPEVAAVLRTMDRDQLHQVDLAWSEASKVTPGESEGSADS